MPTVGTYQCSSLADIPAGLSVHQYAPGRMDLDVRLPLGGEADIYITSTVWPDGHIPITENAIYSALYKRAVVTTVWG